MTSKPFNGPSPEPRAPPPFPVTGRGAAGVTAIDTSPGPVTVSAVEPCTEPEAAVIAVLPALIALSSPAALITATPIAEELQVTVPVRFCVLPSLYVPVAVNCYVAPTATGGFAGVTAMETSAGGPTVAVVEPHTEPAQALTVAEPAAKAYRLDWWRRCR